jgi:hypothetical protein
MERVGIDSNDEETKKFCVARGLFTQFFLYWKNSLLYQMQLTDLENEPNPHLTSSVPY